MMHVSAAKIVERIGSVLRKRLDETESSEIPCEMQQLLSRLEKLDTKSAAAGKTLKH
jgi:hypothetical protein